MIRNKNIQFDQTEWRVFDEAREHFASLSGEIDSLLSTIRALIPDISVGAVPREGPGIIVQAFLHATSKSGLIVRKPTWIPGNLPVIAVDKMKDSTKVLIATEVVSWAENLAFRVWHNGKEKIESWAVSPTYIRNQGKIVGFLKKPE